MTDVSVGIVGERTIIVGQRTDRFLMFLYDLTTTVYVLLGAVLSGSVSFGGDFCLFFWN